MIIYVTKETAERYKIKMHNELPQQKNKIAEAIISKESGDRLLEWGGKLFYFDRRKCIQIVNFASKLTLFLFDIKVADLPEVGNYIANYLMDIYASDKQMKDYIEKYFKEAPVWCFSKLTDKSAISTLNRTQWTFAEDGYMFYDYIEDGILKTRAINKRVNTAWLFTQKVNGKTEYFRPAEKFRELLLDRYQC